jgi:hypothetical protein
VTVRWRVADRDGNYIGEVLGSGGTITWNGTARVQRTCSGVRFDNAGWNDVNPFTDWLLPVIVDDGVDRPLGLFTVLDDTRRFIGPENQSLPSPYLADGAVLLDQPSLFTLAGRLGEQLSSVAERFLDAAGVTRRVVVPTGDTVGEPVAVPAGNTYLDGLLGIALLAGFLPPYFDAHGVLRFEPPRPITDAAVVEHDGATIVAESRVVSDDLLDAPNTFLVVGGGATNAPVLAVAEVSPSAPNSIINRGGRRVTKVIREQGIVNATQAEQIARTIAATDPRSYGQVSFTTPPDWRHDSYTLVNVYGETYRETQWSLDLSPNGLMTHVVTKAEPLVLA